MRPESNGVATHPRFLTDIGASFASAATASAVISAQQLSWDVNQLTHESRVESRRVTFRAGGRQVVCHLSKPVGAGRCPGIVIIAGNRADERYLLSASRSLAAAGLASAAPSLASSMMFDQCLERGAPPAGDISRRIDADDIDVVRASATCLRSFAPVPVEQLGLIGFCAGGRLALMCAAHDETVQAVVAFHPVSMTGDELAAVKAAVQIHHGTDDRAVPYSSSVDVESHLRRHRTPVELLPYFGCQHGFATEARPHFDARAASLAWSRTRSFLNRRLQP